MEQTMRVDLNPPVKEKDLMYLEKNYNQSNLKT